MATSGKTTFNPDATEIAEEAFERCGLELDTGYDNETARRSMNFMLTHWANRGINLWTVSQRRLELVVSQSEYSLASDITDIITAVILDTNTSTDTNITRISREKFLNIPNKGSTGRPSQWYLERGADHPVLNLWLTPSLATYTFKYNCMTRIQDISQAVDEVHMPFRFYEAFVAGLAFNIAVKKPQVPADKVMSLKSYYDECFAEASAEDRDKVSLTIIPDVSMYYRV